MNDLQTISVIGLGYVGLPIAVAFGEKYNVVAFDISEKRISELREGIDITDEVELNELKSSRITFTSSAKDLSQGDFHIITVPTPVNKDKQPDLTFLVLASKILGEQLKKGNIVVYESTVYPGATEEECIPVLEQYSNLKAGKDFFVGYSPERINPGDKEHTFSKITKVVSGQDKETLETIAATYGNVVKAGVYKASSIKVAEAAKVIENTQRDLNIALINELAIIFNKMGINTREVLEVAATKWNFLNFKPGLVGGHCIGVDPYYLTYKAELMGLHPKVILSGRSINDNMGKYIADQTVRQIIQANHPIKNARVAILGLTFKENCPDIRNTRVIDIYNKLKDYAVDVLVHDPRANSEKAKEEYNIVLSQWDDLNNLDAIILAVPHDEYLKRKPREFVDKLQGARILMDVKSVLDRKQMSEHNINLWWL